MLQSREVTEVETSRARNKCDRSAKQKITLKSRKLFFAGSYAFRFLEIISRSFHSSEKVARRPISLIFPQIRATAITHGPGL